MKFGMVAFNAGGHGRSPAQVLRENLDQAALAEELGFDSVWLVEHHFSDYALIGDPAVFAAALAERTRRVRIGTAVIVLPLHHPIRVAENAAVVDNLSDGRLDVGVGRGYQPTEFAGFGVPMEDSQERFDEALRAVELLWCESEVTFRGRHVRLDGVRLVPRPVQQTPPIWIAAVSPPTYVRLGSQGRRILTAPNFTPPDLVRQNLEAYRSALAAGGHDVAAFDSPVMLQTYVGRSHEDGRERPREPAMGYYDLLGRLLPRADAAPPGYDFYRRVEANVRDLRYEQIYGTACFGSADEVRERVRRLRDDAGVTYLMAWFNFGGLAATDVVTSMERFATHVMPAFRERRRDSASDS
jgi:natural product biosynthesis luciferase-like monooxygenase protein